MTERYIHNEMTTFLNRPRGVHFLASAIFRSDTAPRLFPLGLVKDEVYVPPMPITLNNLKD
jgi:hypothetical protein